MSAKNSNKNLRNNSTYDEKSKTEENYLNLKITDENDKVSIVTADGSFEYVQVERPLCSLRNIQSVVPEEELEDLFKKMAFNNDDKIIDSDIERFLLELNQRYGRDYNKEDALAFFNAL